jgi:DNA-binding MarR family transcriptional regulator
MQERNRDPAARPERDIEAYSLNDAPGYLIRRCQQRAVEIFAQELGRTRLTPRQFALLLTLARRPGISQTELVAETSIDRSTLGEMIDRLVRRGLVRRRRSGKDQRANMVAILPAGIALLRECLPAIDRSQARIMMPLPPETRERFLDALRLMARDQSAPGPAKRETTRRRS